MEYKRMVGLRINHYRKLNDKTLADVAKEVGITEATMQKYEAGKISRVDLEMLDKIAKAVGTTPDIIAGWKAPVEDLTFDEKLLLERYRRLDAYGKEFCNLIIKRETERFEEMSRLE